eukprot:m51a1_g12240 putative dna (cytosine-5)-methyltransferase (1149) ;mRNA; r:103255-108938
MAHASDVNEDDEEPTQRSAPSAAAPPSVPGDPAAAALSEPLAGVMDYSVCDASGTQWPLTALQTDPGTELYAEGVVHEAYSLSTAARVGPLTEWWVGDRGLCVGTSTGSYRLSSPLKTYAPLVPPVLEAWHLCKTIAVFVEENGDGTFDDLLSYIHEAEVPPGVPAFTAEALLRHADFVVDELTKLLQPDAAALQQSPAFKTLVDFSSFQRSKAASETDSAGSSVMASGSSQAEPATQASRCSQMTRLSQSFESARASKSAEHSKAATTPLVYNLFNNSDIAPREGRQKTPLGDSPLGGIDSQALARELTAREARWVGEGRRDGARTYYTAVDVGGMTFWPGDHVAVLRRRGDTALQICTLTSLFEKDGTMNAHGKFFRHGSDTFLGETANPCELFVVADCDTFPVKMIKCEVRLRLRVPAAARPGIGLTESLRRCLSAPRRAWQTDPDKRDTDFHLSAKSRDAQVQCPNCSRVVPKNEILGEVAKTDPHLWRYWYSSITVQGTQYNIGDFVFVVADAWPYPKWNMYDPPESNPEPEVDPDPDMFPEHYRKKLCAERSATGMFTSSEKPYGIGRVLDIVKVGFTSVSIKLRRLYRPEETFLPVDVARRKNWNELYWSDKTVEVHSGDLDGKCAVYHVSMLPEKVLRQNPVLRPDLFFFKQCYDPEHETMREPEGDVIPSLPAYSDADTGFIDSKWAIEIDPLAAKAFKLNNPGATVFTEDCNAMLESMMRGETKSPSGKLYPKKGEIDMIVGGPPCQGYSRMNRFSHTECSKFRVPSSLLVVSFLSYLDFFRPKFFVLENVAAFASFKKNLVLRVVFRTLLEMGYQCAFGVLQAGNYGVPQGRRRTIVFAAAPGQVLPQFPDPLFVFPKARYQMTVGQTTFAITAKRGAPFRPMSVWDALSDLPEIGSGTEGRSLELHYVLPPLSHYQRLMRAKAGKTLYDHVARAFGPLKHLQMQHIPKKRGADWRDLPNIEVTDSAGTVYPKLQYTHDDPKYGKSKTGALRGVCACAQGKKCGGAKKMDSLIPWCLPHTAYKNNQWAGLYGRLDMLGYFTTTVTSIDPISKQGRVLHPLQDRVVSVRECARSQGFPDHFRLCPPRPYKVDSMYKQVGNAVPPPLALALGLKVGEAVRKTLADAEPEGHDCAPSSNL